MKRERLKAEFRLVSCNIIPLSNELCERLDVAIQNHLKKYPFLNETNEEDIVDVEFHCPKCDTVIPDWPDQIINSNVIVCESCGTLIFHIKER